MGGLKGSAQRLGDSTTVGAHGLVFTSRAGDPLRRSAFGEAWARAAARAELPDWATFHDLRHFYASLLIARNCSIKAVQTRLGHL